MKIISRIVKTRSFLKGIILFTLPLLGATQALAQTNPILFVTQVPIPSHFTTIGAVFGDHEAGLRSVGRGGDLMIKYPDGTLKNLTKTAGFGSTTQMQGATAISVRDPSVHWDGTKALFSMVIGAPTEQYQVKEYYWQIYEITGIGQGQRPVITKVPNQPSNYNNITPIYGTDDRIIFTSDRPLNGQAHLYPQLDEYELEPTNTGLWSLDPNTGDLFILNHAPSGNFSPMIDSYGKVIFVQWDHLQQDQFADTDRKDIRDGDPLTYGTFNFSSEAANAKPLFNNRTEVFPEPRDSSIQVEGTNLEGHRFNHFIPWQINEDGTDMETVNHIGRHEIHKYIERTFTDDPNVKAYYGQSSIPRENPTPIDEFIQISQDPTQPGRYYGIDAPETRSHGAGQIVRMNAYLNFNADQIRFYHITHPDTSSITNSPSPAHSGLYRDPLMLSDGTLIAAHTSETREDRNTGSRQFPQSLYDFRIKTIVPSSNGYRIPGTSLTNGIHKTIKYWDPDRLVTYSGILWEWQPVEVRSRPRPATRTASLPSIENDIFNDTNVDKAKFQEYMRERGLSLIVTRDVTSRDDKDVQQPFNLKVANSSKQRIGANGKVYTVSHLQIFQADLIRALRDGGGDIKDGRRVIGQAMHYDEAVYNNPSINGPQGSVEVASDGSVAAFLPSRRAVAWQLTSPSHEAVVRERNWLTFQPGEIRACGSCHGVNDKDQTGAPPPTNSPLAMRKLLRYWKNALSLRNDFDDDNKADMLWRHGSSGVVRYFQMNGNHVTRNRVITQVGNQDTRIVATGDFNADGHADLMWRNRVTGSNWMHLLEGSKIIGSQAIAAISDTNWDIAGTGDLDDDGDSDLVWHNSTTGANRVWLMDGVSISSSVGLPTMSDSNYQIVGVEDINGDDKDDIVWRNSSNGRNWLWLMDGSSIQTSQGLRTLPDTNWKVAAIGDVNGDSRGDIIWRNQSTGKNYIWLLDGNTVLLSKGLNTISNPDWYVAQMGDFNGDGKADVFWRNDSANLNWMWLMNGANISSSVNVYEMPDRQWQVALKQ